MTPLITGIAAIVLYSGTSLYQASLVRQGDNKHRQGLLAGAGAALLAHGITAWLMVFRDAGIDFSLWQISVAIAFVVNLLVVTSSTRKPVHGLFLLLFPLSILFIACALLFSTNGGDVTRIGPAIGIHVLFSLLAYSLFIIAAGQAVLLAFQDHRLKNHHPGGMLRALPPLQTMESLLFEVLWGGFILLTLGLVTGFMFLEDIFAQHLAHKTVFSLIAWTVFAILLWGRHRLGWRGHIAIRWTFSGFLALVLAYWGSKFVLEVLLG